MNLLKATLFASTATAILATASYTTVALATQDHPSISSLKSQPVDDSGTMKRADRDMQNVIRALGNLNGKPIEKLTPEEARLQPTAADAVIDVLKDQGKDVNELKAEMNVATRDVTFKSDGKTLKARIYTPDSEDRYTAGALPVIVYYHGGGFVIADIDTYDASARALTKKTGAIVVSADYRRAPEHKFPAAHNDAYAAFKWVVDKAAEWGGNPENVAVAGESAGGNLAINVAIKARDEKFQAPVHMTLIYPLAGNDLNTKSYQDNINAKPLNKAMMEWFVKQALSKEIDKNDPRINVIAANLANLPSSTIITAEIDPLLSEGQKLAELLDEAENKVEAKTYEGVTHEFFGMDAVVSDAADAQEYAAKNLKDAFDSHAKQSSSTIDKSNGVTK